MDNITRALPQHFMEVMHIWESSVRATHFFIKEADICFYKEIIETKYLAELDIYLFGVEGSRKGFIGVSGTSLEMLFVAEKDLRTGIGKALLQYAIRELGVQKLDVNEQNENALGFYTSFGFVERGRSPTDGTGKPYPIIHMVLQDFEA